MVTELERQHRGIMKKDKSYFGTYTTKQISMIEGEYYTVRFDSDFFNEDGYYLFTKSQAKTIYDRLIKDLVVVVREGIKKDREYASDLIMEMVIEPVRYH